MSALNIVKAATLPGSLTPNTIYLIPGDTGELLIHVADKDGVATRSNLSKAQIEALIAAASTSGADKLTTARVIASTGDVTWEVTFDGSGDVSSAATLANVHGAAIDVGFAQVDRKGRVTSLRALDQDDIPDLDGDKIVSTLSVDTTGNAGTATKLATARTINGVSFDGTQNITINAEDATPRIASSEKGATNGVATLDAQGLIPTNQLPSFVDDVVEYANLAAFPVSGEDSKIYVALDTNLIYRWSGSQYINIPSGVGVAEEAVSLVTARTIAATGDITWSVLFDGSANVSAAATLTAIGAGGDVGFLEYDTKGRVTAARALEVADIPELDYTTVVSAASLWIGTPAW
jgi:hypothetical protein